jgi:hypothetical protein
MPMWAWNRIMIPRIAFRHFRESLSIGSGVLLPEVTSEAIKTPLTR